MNKIFYFTLLLILYLIFPSASYAATCTATDIDSLQTCVKQVKSGQTDSVEITDLIECESNCQIDLTGVNNASISGANEKAGIKRLANFNYPLLNIWDSHDITIRNLTFEENYHGECQPHNPQNPLEDDCSSQIVIWNSNDITLDEINIPRSEDFGISIYKANGLEIKNSKFSNIYGGGLWFDKNPQNASERVIIKNNLFENSEGGVNFSAIGIEENPNIIEGNTFNHTHKDSVWFVCGANQNEACGGGQLLIQDVDHLIVRNNIIKNGYNESYDPIAPVSGIELWFKVHNTQITGNDIYDNSGWGIISNHWDVVDIDNVNIINNRVYNSGINNIEVPRSLVENNCHTQNCTFLPTLSWHNQEFTFPAGDNVFSIPQHDRQQSLDRDVAITKATLRISGITPGTLFDTGINFNRRKEPAYLGPTGGYTEILGLNVNRLSSSADWSITIDLTNTPLYLPKETEVVCTAVAYGVNDTTKNSLRFNCDLEYQNYVMGSPRFRILRFPYSDQTSLQDGSMAVSHYRSSHIFPLRIKAMSLFQSFGGDSAPATMTNACLRWLKPDKSLVQKQCFPDQSVTPGQDNPTPNILPLDWQLDTNDLLTASCDNTRQNTDCGIWAFAEISKSIPSDPSAIFKDFGNIPRQSLVNYCQENIDMLTHPFYCDYQTSCDRAFKLDRCQTNLFPSALIPGDINQDAKVDIFDYNLLVADFGKSGSPADLNGNGKVDIFDYNLLVANFGK